ncbi:hypothetical protein [Nocardia cyriacigeorgica]|uniref:hypothetical protein n=1 Tax=Nocardia cyriacigeorgica TaxID=135487 RepID=UPI002F95416B
MLSAIADDHDASMIVLGAPRHGLASLVERLLGESVASRLIHPRNPAGAVGAGT